ncbi:hypothetical protein [Clostridium sp.]|uniref:hypothetical protein n=1 Tax=Clostridium sp. TaxID=1506 RepID=UPI0025C00B4E|nr:hypothetical protein [Clostridium sp.]
MIENSIRTLFWAVAKLFLSVGDWIYEILESVIAIDLSQSKVIMYTWLFMLLFLSSSCLIRVGFIFIKKNSSDSEGFDGFKIIKRIGAMFLVVAISTTCFTFALGIPKTVTDIYSKVITYDERLTPSSAVISATAKTSITNSLSDMSETDEVISIETIDEKLNEEENGKKIYFPTYAEILLCVVTAFIVACVQVNIITDTILRLFLNIFRFVIGFIPISSMVEDNSTCGEWVRDIISDTFVMCCMLIFTKMVFGIMATSSITSLNGIVRMVVFTIGLMAVSKSGEFIAKYMGASNLSSGGKSGSMLLGMGAMMAVRGAGKILKGVSKYTGKGINKAYSQINKKNNSKNSNFKGGDNEVNTSKTSPNSGQGLGVNKDGSRNLGNYFVNNGGKQNNFKNGSVNNKSDRNILDKKPTDANRNSKGNINDNQRINKEGIVSSNIKTPKDNIKGKNKENLNSNKNELGKSNYRKFGKLRDMYNSNNKGFVDTQTSGHLYKKSSSVYKKSARDIANNNLKNKKNINKVGGMNENNGYERSSTDKL